MTLVLKETDISRFMTELGPRLIAVARGICRDSDLAEDIVQEAFVKLWKTPPDGPEQVVPSWMRRVVINLSINQLRRRKRTERMPEFSTDPALRCDHRPDRQVELSDNVNRVQQALDKISADKRAIIVMRVYEQMAYQDIANALDIPVGTVMSRLNRARKALKEQLEQDLMHPNEEPLIFPIREAKQG